MSEEKPVDIGNANMRRLRAMLYRLSTSEGAAYGEVEREIIAYVGNLATPASPASAQPVSIAGLGSVTNEDDGVLTLRFKDEDAALDFMHSISPTVDCRDMPDAPAPDEPVSQPVVAVPSVKQLTAQLEDYEEKWTPAEQRAFAEFLARFPNESSQGIISLGSAWKHGQRYVTPLAAPVERGAVHWDLFPAYLVDHCEREVIYEESIQHWIAAMLKDEDYLRISAERAAAPVEQEKQPQNKTTNQKGGV